MKKLTMICMSALLVLAVSCKKDKKTEVENAGSGFRATVESHEGTGKTHLDDKAVKWDSGDAILVKSSASTCTTPMRFTTTGTDASASFVAAESLDEDFYTPPYTGYYPASAFDDDQLTLPATQNYVENTFASGANPMAATSNETLLPFKNVCGVLKLQLYSETACNVDNITITSNKEGEMLWGTGTVSIDGNGIPSLGTLTDGGSTLMLAMGEGGKPMSIEEENPTNYYFVVPVGTLGESFTVTVTDTDGKVWTKTANSSANRIARSQITKMPELPVTVTKAHEYVDLGLPSGLLWATCNLGAEHEYDYGDYYAWGEIEPYYAEGHSQDDPCNTWRSMTTGAGNTDITNGYAWETYFPGGSSDYEWPEPPYGDDEILTSDYDAATKNWGSAWRMPTTAEWQELPENTYMKWVYDYDGTDVPGFIVYKVKYEDDKGLFTIDINYDPENPAWSTLNQSGEAVLRGEYSLTDVHLFLPIAGDRVEDYIGWAGTLGCYWSSSLVPDNTLEAYYSGLSGVSGVNPHCHYDRFNGLTVRPVSDVPNASGNGSLNDFGGGNW